ncbi:MAG TPA: SAM-dependent methyltransferase [Polyangia bacterium]|nr:SAM-dependent methyltransferase [Polyangia bacterium]
MTADFSRDRGPADGHLGLLGLDDLPAPSSLMSSRWSRDNLVTSHPARLYDGKIVERIGPEVLDRLIAELPRNKGPVRRGAVRMGVFTWDISCADDGGPFVLQIPLVLDERGRRERAKRDVPRLNVESMRSFAAQGLTRFVAEPIDLFTLVGDVPAATFVALPDYHPLTFGRGFLQVDLYEGKLSWAVPLGAGATADLLAEMVAALVYHYDPDTDGGLAITDVFVNDGDFVAKRRTDGSFEVRLTAARRREGGIGRNLLLLYLIQMMAYEDWSVGGDLTGLPVLIGNPSVAFAGLVRGLRYRHRDLGGREEEGAQEALRWIQDFGRSSEGHAYRPFVDRFLAGRLPPRFGEDPREGRWRLISLQTKLGILELRARQTAGAGPASSLASSAQVVRAFIDRLSRELGRVPDDDAGTVRINDLGREGLLRLLGEPEARIAPESRESVADELLARWPYRGLDHLLAAVPGARGLRKLKRAISFGRIVPQADEGTLTSLAPPPRGPGEGGRARPVANRELYGGLSLPPSLEAAAACTFPTFEAYMDAALHDPKWGYYAHGVAIGRGGHFGTHPEEFSPRYGKWIARWAFRFWREMVARGDLSETEPFSLIELGAGNGRLARDLLDHVARAAQTANDPQLAASAEGPLWRTFASRLEYRIYETSASLRDKQRALLGAGASVCEGDARRPAETLRRDFPDGVKGLVLSNELPDAFGVHKVVLTSEGRALAALVVPRVEAALREALAQRVDLDDGLCARITEADRAVRQTFGFRGNSDDCYLDGQTYAQLMETLAALPAETREPLLNALWFEEAYVPASVVPELAAHLRANAAEYAAALAAEDSGVVTYVNVHAGRFIQEVGACLRSGFVVTIDYGDTTQGLIRGARRGEFPFRVYGQWRDYVPRPNDPYAAPGTQDMTADVNFTDLARAGRQAGLEVLHFGPERDVTADDVAELLATADEEPVAMFLGNPLFKVLVLGSRPSDVFAGPLMTSLPLSSREQDVPKSRRAKIATIEKALQQLLA